MPCGPAGLRGKPGGPDFGADRGRTAGHLCPGPTAGSGAGGAAGRCAADWRSRYGKDHVGAGDSGDAGPDGMHYSADGSYGEGGEASGGAVRQRGADCPPGFGNDLEGRRGSLPEKREGAFAGGGGHRG